MSYSLVSFVSYCTCYGKLIWAFSKVVNAHAAARGGGGGGGVLGWGGGGGGVVGGGGGGGLGMWVGRKVVV
jgi:hypothetical protein